MKRKNRKGSFTVEAALICPFLCLVVCAMIVTTISFYKEVERYGTETIRELENADHNTAMLRLERTLMEFST